MARLLTSPAKPQKWVPRPFAHVAKGGHDVACSAAFDSDEISLHKQHRPRPFGKLRAGSCRKRTSGTHVFNDCVGQVKTGATRRSILTLHAVNPCYILNQMVQYYQAHFDASFGALSDATRRGVLEQLGRADASITALAESFHMTLTGMKKHVGVLEQAGLVSTEKVGRVRTCKLGLRGLEEEAAWIERYRQLWAARFDELDIVVEELKRQEKANGRKKRK